MFFLWQGLVFMGYFFLGTYILGLVVLFRGLIDWAKERDEGDR
jgi:hypothetical protein